MLYIHSSGRLAAHQHSGILPDFHQADRNQKGLLESTCTSTALPPAQGKPLPGKLQETQKNARRDQLCTDGELQSATLPRSFRAALRQDTGGLENLLWPLHSPLWLHERDQQAFRTLTEACRALCYHGGCTSPSSDPQDSPTLPLCRYPPGTLPCCVLQVNSAPS